SVRAPHEPEEALQDPRRLERGRGAAPPRRAAARQAAWDARSRDAPPALRDRAPRLRAGQARARRSAPRRGLRVRLRQGREAAARTPRGRGGRGAARLPPGGAPGLGEAVGARGLSDELEGADDTAG